ncbi:MAG TPA: NADPH-dependent FMN reductase [Beijerinckiaceae bacterium]|nr:NADPH-dependent FMN reductase [Beijerinckiaceae bacterium]
MSVKILVFSGSSRAGSVNDRLAGIVARQLQGMGAEVTYINLGKFDLPMVNADGYGSAAPKAAHDLRAIIDEHDGLFIVSPEYNAGYTPLLKNALDWASVAKPGAPASGLSGKVVALGAVSPGPMGGYRSLTQLRTVLELGFGATLVPEMVAVGNAGSAFAESGGLADERTAGFLNATLSKLITMTKKLKA